jgi:hypothetical protein
MNAYRLKSLLLIPVTAALAVTNPAHVLALLLLSLPAGAEEGVIPAREGTLHVLSFGVGAPMDGPPVDDLYGRDAGFVAEALKRSPAAWTRVETTFVSGLACTPERLRTELERLAKAASASDLVLIHASTHGTTEDGFLRLDGAKGPPVLNANILAASLAGLPCPSLVTIDACMAGGAVRSRLPPRSAWLLGCSETQSTSGQYDDRKVPHGFLVLALCEALRGDADADRDGVVTVGELCAWVPKRATYLARFSCLQDAEVVLPADLATLPLTRAVPGKHKPLWTMARVESRNPWGLPDPPALPQNAQPAAELVVALKDRPTAAKARNGCEGMAKPPEPGQGDSLDGTWASRWGEDEAKQLKNQGRAEIAETKHGFFAAVLDKSGSYLIEAARDPADPTRLSGRWVSLGSPKQSSRWEGRIVDKRRIDGQSFKGVWDFRR